MLVFPLNRRHHAARKHRTDLGVAVSRQNANQSSWVLPMFCRAKRGLSLVMTSSRYSYAASTTRSFLGDRWNCLVAVQVRPRAQVCYPCYREFAFPLAFCVGEADRSRMSLLLRLLLPLSRLLAIPSPQSSCRFLREVPLTSLER